MRSVFLKVTIVLVGGHLLFGSCVAVLNFVNGTNDQNISFALSMLFYCLNYPMVLLLKAIDIEVVPLSLLFAGLLQWGLISLAVSGLVGIFKIGKKTAPENI
jgi:hypothetical protein